MTGVKAATAEYGAGMMRLTLTATPRRGRVIAAKVLVVTAVTLLAALVCNVAMFLLAHAILSAYGIETTRLGDADALRAVLGAAAGPSPAVAALVVAGWLAVFLGGAWTLFERRDA